MRLVRVDIAKFRAIDSTSLTSCGALNVLIGKNNSGKSTILDAIDGFFAVVSSPYLVASPDLLVGRGEVGFRLGKESDFHRGDSDLQPIRISVDFTLTASECDDIVKEIISEAPQMRNALEGIERDVRLRIEVTSIKNDRELAYISNMQLVQDEATDPGSQARILLALTSEAALEILGRKGELIQANRQAQDILQLAGRIDSEDFQVIRREARLGERPASSSAMRLRRLLSVSSTELGYDIDSLIQHAEDYGDFTRQIETIAKTRRNAAKTADEEPLEHAILTFSGEARVLPSYAPKILERVGAISVLHLRDRRDPVGREEAQRLLSLKTRRKGPEVLRNIQETVHSLLGVSIDAFESDATGDARAEMDVDDVLVEMNGAGIREALRLILDNELSQPQLLLVEEPEIHLHPALELSMLRYLRFASSRTQVFVTTHSTNFLDTSEMRNVYLTRREPWVNASQLDYEQAETAIPDELGLRLSSLFMYDRLVFVEGASDEAILRELAPLVGVNFGQTNLGFVIMGSSRNFTHYASEATIDFLTKRRVKMSFILDRDEASEEDVEALKRRLGDLAETHILNRREIENYLLAPRALTEFIRESRQLQGLDADTVSESLVIEQIEESADGLRQLAVQKRILRSLFTPIYFDRNSVFEATDAEFDNRLCAEIDRQIAALGERKNEIQAMTEQVETSVGQVWDSEKLAIVPGDELLDCVCRKFEVRFKKRRDGSRIARLLKIEELPAELINLLKGLVS
jgi:putative ATP-dependent endonuclease of OLD family